MAGAQAIEIGSAIGNNINIFKDISSGLEGFLSERDGLWKIYMGWRINYEAC